MRRQVEAQLAAERRHCFRGRGLTENRLGQITRQQLDAEEDDQRDDEQGEEAQRQALGHHFEYFGHRPGPW